jgi:hypothetical protein
MVHNFHYVVYTQYNLLYQFKCICSNVKKLNVQKDYYTFKAK